MSAISRPARREHGPDRRHRADAHHLRRHADGRAGDDARERRLARSAHVVRRGDQGGRRAVDDGGGVAAGLHPAEGRPDGCQRLDRRRAHMGVGGELLLALELQAARRIAGPLERFVRHRSDLAREEAGLLRRDGAREALRGEAVDLRSCDLVLAGQVLGGIAHAHIGRRIEQGFPEEILEIDCAHAKPAHRIGRDRIAAHGFRADAERERDLPVRDEVGRLHQHFDAGAAYPLHHVRRHLDRHIRIEPDMTRQTVGVEARLRHGAGDHGADVLRRDARAREDCARRLDAEIGGRGRRKRAVVIRERRAHAVEQPDVGPAGGEPWGLGRHGHVSISDT